MHRHVSFFYSSGRSLCAFKEPSECRTTERSHISGKTFPPGIAVVHSISSEDSSVLSRNVDKRFMQRSSSRLLSAQKKSRELFWGKPFRILNIFPITTSNASKLGNSTTERAIRGKMQTSECRRARCLTVVSMGAAHVHRNSFRRRTTTSENQVSQELRGGKR